jgi:hypothetical protein
MVAAFGLIVFLTLERLGADVELLSIIGSRQDSLPDAGFLARGVRHDRGGAAPATLTAGQIPVD